MGYVLDSMIINAPKRRSRLNLVTLLCALALWFMFQMPILASAAESNPTCASLLEPTTFNLIKLIELSLIKAKGRESEALRRSLLAASESHTPVNPFPDQEGALLLQFHTAAQAVLKQGISEWAAVVKMMDTLLIKEKDSSNIAQIAKQEASALIGLSTVRTLDQSWDKHTQVIEQKGKLYLANFSGDADNIKVFSFDLISGDFKNIEIKMDESARAHDARWLRLGTLVYLVLVSNYQMNVFELSEFGELTRIYSSGWAFSDYIKSLELFEWEGSLYIATARTTDESGSDKSKVIKYGLFISKILPDFRLFDIARARMRSVKDSDSDPKGPKLIKRIQEDRIKIWAHSSRAGLETFDFYPNGISFMGFRLDPIVRRKVEKSLIDSIISEIPSDSKAPLIWSRKLRGVAGSIWKLSDTNQLVTAFDVGQPMGHYLFHSLIEVQNQKFALALGESLVYRDSLPIVGHKLKEDGTWERLPNFVIPELQNRLLTFSRPYVYKNRVLFLALEGLDPAGGGSSLRQYHLIEWSPDSGAIGIISSQMFTEQLVFRNLTWLEARDQLIVVANGAKYGGIRILPLVHEPLKGSDENSPESSNR